MKAMRPNAPAWADPTPRKPSDSDDPKTGYDITVPPRPGTGDENPGDKPADGGKSGS